MNNRKDFTIIEFWTNIEKKQEYQISFDYSVYSM